MKVRYVHTFTVTVEGSDQFHSDESMAKVVEEGKRDASYVTLLVKRGGGEPKPVRSSVRTQTVVIEDGQ